MPAVYTIAVVEPMKDWLGRWWLSLLIAVTVPVLLSLGYWQLERANHKRTLLALQTLEQAKPALAVDSLKQPLPEFRTIQVRGRYDTERYWLLENRIHQGRYGFEVLSPFVTDRGETILVHRGWVPGDRSRRTLPEVETPAGLVSLTGVIDAGTATGFALGEEVVSPGWPRRVQWLTHNQAEQALDTSLPDLLLRLERGQPGMYTPTYSAVNMPPEKHTGYAVQWFAMAAVIAALYLWRMWRLTKRSTGE